MMKEGWGGWGVKISKGGEADYRPELTSFWREEKSYSEELMKVVAAPVRVVQELEHSSSLFDASASNITFILSHPLPLSLFRSLPLFHSLSLLP